jgi:hypothetical protein
MVDAIALRAAALVQLQGRQSYEEPQKLQPNEEPQGQQDQLAGDTRPDATVRTVRMTSVARVSKFPVIEESLKIATNIYKKTKVRLLAVNFD